MSKELDDAYFRSTPCTHHEPLLSKLVDCVNLLEERIKGLLGATVSVGSTETLPAGSEATASATKRGYDTVLDFGIPRGEKGDKGEPGEPGAPGEPGRPGSDATATDVRINGKSITADGVADIPTAVPNSGSYGVVKMGGNSNGLRINSIGEIAIVDASDPFISNRANGSYPITTRHIDYAVKAAMCDGKGVAWTTTEKNAAKKRIGIDAMAPGTRLWFSNQEPGSDIETDGQFGFKLTALASAENLNAVDYLKEFDIILWNGYAYFVLENDGNEALGDTKMAFAPHTA